MGDKAASEGFPAGASGVSAVGAGAARRGGAQAWDRHARDQAPRLAPGQPGSPSHWFASDKDGVGTAITPTDSATSLVWFTLGHGILNEIFYPRMDEACTRDLGLIVTDGRDFFSEEQRDAEHQVDRPFEGAPLFHLTNTCKQGRYRIEKVVFANPRQDAVIQQTRFVPLQGSLDDYHLYALLSATLANRGADNTAWLGEHRGIPMLFAERAGRTLALACSTPWAQGSVGFVGASDGWQDLSRHKRLTWDYDRAERGNVALTGEVDLRSGDGTSVLAVGFGPNPDEAGHRALASLLDDFDELREEYVRGWRDWQRTLAPLRPPEGGGRDLYRVSTAVLRSHDAEAVPGAMTASLSIPWGDSRGDEQFLGTGGYHLVWPRDLVESAGGYLAAGARAEPLRVLRYLRATQGADGHWPQNMWVNSKSYWEGRQLGETSFPILLTDLLRRAGVLDADAQARFWPMVRRAVSYIVRSGPSTHQDRWENQEGYTPFTLAVVIVALLIAADQADERGEPAVATFLRETADAWNAAIESWLYVTGTDLARRVGVEGYYIRSIPPGLDERSTPRQGRLTVAGDVPSKKGTPITEIVSPDALALVRFGLRRPDDPRILDTIKVIDAVLKVETPFGPSWHRFNGDGYGEHPDGSPYASGADGVGRAWPLLTGERAHYELLAGRRDEAVRLLRAMAAFAGDGGLIPEQVWDSDDLPDKGLLLGRPSGSAMPLVWAHAEYIKLLRSLADGRAYDLPPQTARRYLAEDVGSDRVIWRLDHRRRAISAGEVLRVEDQEPAAVHWSADGDHSTRETPTHDTGLGLHIADLDTKSLPPGSSVRFSIRRTEDDGREPEEFRVEVV